AAATIDGLIRLARQIADADGGFLGLFGRVSDKEDEAVAELAGRLRADATMTLPPAAALLASLDEAAAAPEPVQLLPTAETPATRVLLGSPPAEAGRFSNEGPQVEARISALFVDKVPVTQRLYRDVIGQNPSYRVNDLAPVTEVSWLDALLYCNRLSTVAGLTPCYAIDESEVAWTRGADGYRLPTEAEWEAVARAGTTGAYACAADPAVVAEHAWFGRGLSEGPYPVAEKHPNPWGLYDVHGNVWEWCWDVYAEGPAASSASACGLGGLRTARGGCYFDPLRMARSASRYAFSWSERSSRLGFRCVRDRR
ncbi:MAG: formylglycine-generating enzyme family protein, partial [Myxococcales bacterium]|nr:formylglycine-generating enzyme family protein [Myxococcales bacterium]